MGRVTRGDQLAVGSPRSRRKRVMLLGSVTSAMSFMRPETWDRPRPRWRTCAASSAPGAMSRTMGEANPFVLAVLSAIGQPSLAPLIGIDPDASAVYRMMKLGAFAQATVDARPDDEEDIAKHDLSLLEGCTKPDIGLLERLLSKTLELGDGLRRAKEHASAVHVFEGAALDASRKLPARCAGPKRELATARRSMESAGDDEEKSTLLRDAFRSLLDVSSRWRKSSEGSRRR